MNPSLNKQHLLSKELFSLESQPKDLIQKMAQLISSATPSWPSVFLPVERDVGGLGSGAEQIRRPAGGGPAAEGGQSVHRPGFSTAGCSSAGCRPSDPAGHQDQAGG